MTLRKNLVSHLAVDVCEAKIPARVTIGQLQVVQAQQMQHRRVQVMHMDPILPSEVAVIVGVSRDSLKSHENFKAKQEFPFDLLSDQDEALCTLFDVIKEKNMYGRKVMGIERSTFLIDSHGKLRKQWRKVKVDGHVEEILAAVRELNRS